MKRKRFLSEFLGALGVVKINFTDETNDKICGTAFYSQDDFEESQDFVWHLTEEQVPNEDILKIIELLNTDKMLDIDKIILSRDKLFQRFSSKYNSLLSYDEFILMLDELENIKVTMIDEGVETDYFFIHE